MLIKIRYHAKHRHGHDFRCLTGDVISFVLYKVLITHLTACNPCSHTPAQCICFL